jgi:hypothetical protein
MTAHEEALCSRHSVAAFQFSCLSACCCCCTPQLASRWGGGGGAPVGPSTVLNKRRPHAHSCPRVSQLMALQCGFVSQLMALQCGFVSQLMALQCGVVAWWLCGCAMCPQR